jgi:hypothetical protein
MCFSNDSSESIVTPMSDLVHAFLKKWWVESDILKNITPCKALGPKYGQSL